MPPPNELLGRQIEAVLFDLDGTLVETDNELAARLARPLSRVRAWLPQRQVEPAARRLADWASDAFNTGLDALDTLRLDQAARQLAQRWRLIRPATRPFTLVPGVREMVPALAARCRLGIVSSRTQGELQRFVELAGLAEWIAVLAGSDSTRRVKPHPEPVRWAAQQLGLAPAQVVMVGDTRVDIEAAHAAGALAVGVLCGFGDRAELRCADLILPTTAALLDAMTATRNR